MRHAGAAPALAVWKTAVLAVTPMTRMWWLLPVSHRTPLGFSEVLIYLSYAAMVPPRGIAPRSLAYRARALLLSYGGIEGMVARRGNAPRSAGCEPVVLLLNYRAMKNGTRTR